MRTVVKRLAWHVAPAVMADRVVRWNAAVSHRLPGSTRITRVEAGPFEGMMYPAEVADWVSSPALKRDGTYEQALLPVLVEELERRPLLFVNVGASDGYYAVGAATLGLRVIAYESSRIQRNTLLRLAAENGVQVRVRGHCRHIPDVPAGSLILIDAEGAEITLLDQAAIQRLRTATVIVELHENAVPGVTVALERRFAGTHDGELVHGDLEQGRTEPAVWAVFRPVHRPQSVR